MKKFCKLFFCNKDHDHDINLCNQCKEAYAEIKRDEAIFFQIDSPIYKTDSEKAALDCNGQP
jgi:hypothetical protein